MLINLLILNFTLIGVTSSLISRLFHINPFVQILRCRPIHDHIYRLKTVFFSGLSANKFVDQFIQV